MSFLERPTGAVQVQEASLNVARYGRERRECKLLQAASANKCAGRGERHEERTGQEHAPREEGKSMRQHAPTCVPERKEQAQ
jgi:hypothetical protein